MTKKQKNRNTSTYIFLFLLLLLSVLNALIAIPFPAVSIPAEGRDCLANTGRQWFTVDMDKCMLYGPYSSEYQRSSTLFVPGSDFYYYIAKIQTETDYEPVYMYVRLRDSVRNKYESSRLKNLYGMISEASSSVVNEVGDAALTADENVHALCLNANGDTPVLRAVKMIVWSVISAGIIFLLWFIHKYSPEPLPKPDKFQY